MRHLYRLKRCESVYAQDREVAQKALERHNQGAQRLVRRLRDADNELAEIIERELLQANREKQALQKTLADLDAWIEGQEPATANLKSLYDYCRQVENELAVFGFDEKQLALEALGITVTANGREWRERGHSECCRSRNTFLKLFTQHLHPDSGPPPAGRGGKDRKR